MHVPALTHEATPTLRRACACGGHCPRCRAFSAVPVGPADDAYEREADAIADQVMRTPAAGLATSPSPVGVQRKCAACDEEEDRVTAPAVQRKAIVTGQNGADHASAGTLFRSGTLVSGGAPLSESVRTFFEPRFDRDLGHVRVHTGPTAEDQTSAIDAQAFTYASHVWLGRGHAEAPSWLMAHELAHVVQQTSSGAGHLRRGVIHRQPTGKTPPPPVPSATPQPLEVEIIGNDVRVNESIFIMADRWARDHGGVVLRVASIEDMIKQLAAQAQGQRCVGKLVVWYHGSPEIQLVVGEYPLPPKNVRLPASGFSRQWLQLDRNRAALNRFRHLFCCNAMMQWIGCGTASVRAGGGLRTPGELRRDPEFEAYPDVYQSAQDALRHGAKLPGGSFGSVNVRAWADATCTTIRSATNFVTLQPRAKEPVIIDNGGKWVDVAPAGPCPCDPNTGRIAGSAPTRDEMVRSSQKQIIADVGSKNFLWHELLLALRTGLPHVTEVIGGGQQGERTQEVQPGTLPDAVRKETQHRVGGKRGPLEMYYATKVLFPLLQIAGAGITPPSPLPNLPFPNHLFLQLSVGGGWAAVTQRHLAVTNRNDFWHWIVFNDRAIGETPEFTRTVIQHELAHAADFETDLRAFEADHKRPAGDPPEQFTRPAEESAVRNFSGDWGKYINEFIAFQKSRTRPERHLEIILEQRTQTAPSGGRSWDRWSAGERAYWFQLAMQNLPPDVDKNTPVPGEDQVLDAFRTGGPSLRLAAVDRAYRVIRRALCPEKAVEAAEVAALRANARTLVQHFKPIMDQLFADQLAQTTPQTVLQLLRRAPDAERGLECTL